MKATTKVQIEKEIKALKAGELYMIKLANTSVPLYVGVTLDKKNVLMGAFITAQNLSYKNVSNDRIYKSKKDVIGKLKEWQVL